MRCWNLASICLPRLDTGLWAFLQEAGASVTLVLEAITLKPGRSSDISSVMHWNRDQKAGGPSMDQVGPLCSACFCEVEAALGQDGIFLQGAAASSLLVYSVPGPKKSKLESRSSNGSRSSLRSLTLQKWSKSLQSWNLV